MSGEISRERTAIYGLSLAIAIDFTTLSSRYRNYEANMPKLTGSTVDRLLGHGGWPSLDECDRSWRQLLHYDSESPIPVHVPKVFRELADKPLLRLWDNNSRSRPNGSTGSILADRCREPMHDAQMRRQMLASHIDNRNWTQGTPFISFTSSSRDIKRIARQRQHRPRQLLTVIDPLPRLERGLGVVSCYDELKYYGVRDPYDNNYKYYANEYLCLWQVNSDEIVATWPWDDLSENPNWYDAVVLPEWQRFRRERYPLDMGICEGLDHLLAERHVERSRKLH